MYPLGPVLKLFCTRLAIHDTLFCTLAYYYRSKNNIGKTIGTTEKPISVL